MNNAPIVIEGLNYHYGEGKLRRQVLFDINTRIGSGEIVILTGPSGSGKTTLLTLIGALRSAQDGILEVLGHELRGANETELAEVRKRIGYIFQAHNLLEALSAQQNVQVTLQLHPELSGTALENRAAAALDAVGLGDRLGSHPSELSGGERQRVAIARALACGPELLLADEPTASLDTKTGRDLVELLQRLAKKEQVAVILVTHDNRILDIADRILTLEDGRLSSLMHSVTGETQHMMRLLAKDLRRGHLAETLAPMKRGDFEAFLDEVTEETECLLEVVDFVQGEAFESVEQQIIEALTQKLSDLLESEQAAFYLVDPDRDALRGFVKDAKGDLHESHIAGDIRGVCGHVISTAQLVNAAEASLAPEFDSEIDGKDTRSILAAPITDSENRVFAVIQLRNKRTGSGFSVVDEEELVEITKSLGVILESWWRMGCACRRGTVGRQMACCPPNY